ncbi:MAG: hypothetical protein PF440_10430, partial [Thiomicrorhabdus sp.]|nr:hypothetical protein [Thiomicrorhabdus sp.]
MSEIFSKDFSVFSVFSVDKKVLKEKKLVTIDQIRKKKAKIAVVGLGYVGLPLAAAFGKKV